TIDLEHAQRTHHARPARPLLRLAFGLALFVIGLAAASSFITIGRADEPASQTLAILPFEMRDTSGESGAPDRHNAMLAALTRIVGEKIEAAHVYNVVPEQRIATAVAAANSGTFLTNCNGCELDIARSAGAMIGWIYKVSTLVGSLHIEIKDVASGKRTYARVFDFRGDNEAAWQRAADYIVGTMRKARSGAQAPTVGQ
ncbi:MAG: DUF2380 domain-containing protein, partial [Hyphomicrobium sp.]